MGQREGVSVPAYEKMAAEMGRTERSRLPTHSPSQEGMMPVRPPQNVSVASIGKGGTRSMKAGKSTTKHVTGLGK